MHPYQIEMVTPLKRYKSQINSDITKSYVCAKIRPLFGLSNMLLFYTILILYKKKKICNSELFLFDQNMVGD